ncbi:GTPase ObgE [Herpetosiphon geysericola]|uniref:GTPase Obg n=1 Tax=Herpetosiphon geysericola TaxID=70996 RepID=A0A0P6Y894_9CHLR|nr:GTPase ObgE [Herpetosiphon geysericola]KPL85190.1 GTPase ObgE [Herpetosiphon geysericola]
MSDFIDRALITVKAGDGGDGMATFRREKYVPRGGPDGGDGGRGGSIYLEVSPHLNTLLPFRFETHYEADKGLNAGRQRKRGRTGEDMFIRVPPGTTVSAEIEGELQTVDLLFPGQKLLVARGGKGGLGNTHFATASNQVPRIAELGQPGEERELQLELKVIADVGLVGFPNAGKSTLLSMVSAARPKIANYPFTTLSPNLGVAEYNDFTFVVADIPGLIEGASRGVGLGHDFLRHIERTRILVHVVDAAGTEGRDPFEDFQTINAELKAYSSELAQRPQIVALNKTDLPDAQAFDELMRPQIIAWGIEPENIFPISAATNQGLQPLQRRIVDILLEMPERITRLPYSEEILTFRFSNIDPNDFWLETEEDGVLRVHGEKIERLVSMTNFAQSESLDRLQRVLEAMGVSAALFAAGVRHGDPVRIEKAELLWQDESIG